MAHLKFCLNYRTRWSERLCILLCVGNKRTRLRMETRDGYSWEAEWEMPAGTTMLEYAYAVCNESGELIRRESSCGRLFDTGLRSRILLADEWTERGLPPVIRRTAFTDCIFRCAGEGLAGMEPITRPYLLLLSAMPPPKGMRWGVLGSSPAWGEWNPDNVRFLKRTHIYEWGLPLSQSDFTDGVEYKYVLVDERDPRKLIWENGENRYLHPTTIQGNEAAVKQDDTPRLTLPPWRGAGIVVPVFALRSRSSFGIGDFGDLASLTDWAKAAGMHAVQVLPVNDTTATRTWRDSYPYNGISVFALHPIYINPSEWENTVAYKRHAAEGQSLNGLDDVDYEKVLDVKWCFLRDLFKECGEHVTNSRTYRLFCQEQAEWLEPYARFCCLRDRYATADFHDWPADAPEPEDDELELHRFVQFLLDRQLAAAHRRAQANGIVLKGDIPIGVCRNSVPAWKDARLFHFDGQAGAPPDAFAVKGQNWKFPTYNWEEMARDGYAWWRKRLHHMARYFDAYRIDHVLGFFRIWEIPTSQTDGIMGHFRPALPLTEDELRQWGFRSRVERFCRPFVTARRLAELEAQAGPLRDYFQPAEDDCWELRPEWRSQRYIADHLPEGPCRNVLAATATEVLFLPDTSRPGSYHPRIAAQFTDVFRQLPAEDRDAFNRLYDNFFYERHNRFWAEEALRKLPALVANTTAEDGTANNMLPCAEDLGMIPASVKSVLEEFQILSLEIQRMPKDTSRQFSDLTRNPYLSVATIATHDMPPLRLWWQTEREQAQAFWRDVLRRPGNAPQEAAPEMCEEIIAMHLACPSMLCLLALQDWLAMDRKLRDPHPEREQINVPSNPDQYWRYRMPMNLEDLAGATSFTEKLRSLIACNGR